MAGDGKKEELRKALGVMQDNPLANTEGASQQTTSEKKESAPPSKPDKPKR